jgi:hypothetical protein
MVVVLRRLVSGRPVFTGDRRHIHHMLLDRGLSVRQVAMGTYAVSGAFALVSLLVASPSASLVGPVLAILGIAVAIGVQQLRIPELRVLSTHVVRGICRQRSLLACATVVQKMVSDLEQASDAQHVLRVVGRGLADSGFAAATLLVPVWFDLPSGAEDGWRVSDGEPPRAVHSFHWAGDSTGSSALTVVALPLFDDERPGTLSISTQVDAWHQASLINWLPREVAQTVGVHLARTADQSAAGSAARVSGEARSSRSGTHSAVVPHGRGAAYIRERAFGIGGKR